MMEAETLLVRPLRPTQDSTLQQDKIPLVPTAPMHKLQLLLLTARLLLILRPTHSVLQLLTQLLPQTRQQPLL